MLTGPRCNVFNSYNHHLKQRKLKKLLKVQLLSINSQELWGFISTERIEFFSFSVFVPYNLQ